MTEDSLSLPPIKLEIDSNDQQGLRLKNLDLLKEDDDSNSMFVVLPVCMVTLMLIIIMCSYLKCRSKFKQMDGDENIEVEPKLTEEGLSAKKVQDEVFDIPKEVTDNMQTLNPYPETEQAKLERIGQQKEEL